jgi:Tol biopolymer transport system component
MISPVGRVVGALVVAAVVVCSSALGARSGALTGRIVFTATDAPFADDVMLVRLNGRRIDLSKSPAYDADPVVSPDGKHVAFFSTRGGYGAEYIVSTDGRGLHQATPSLDVVQPEVAWSPSGSQLAVLTGSGQNVGEIHVASVTGTSWKLVVGITQPAALVGWSPDGTRMAYTDQLGGLEVVSGTGRKLLDAVGHGGAWSPTGRLVVARDSNTVDVYDPMGKRMNRFAAATWAWSTRDVLATSTAGGLVQFRAHGVGEPSASVRLGNGGTVRWVSPTVLQIGQTTIGYDVTKRHTIKLPGGFSPGASVLPSLAVAFGEPSFGKLAKARVGGTNRIVTAYATCQGRNANAYYSLQALPDGSGAVYAGDCASPSDVFTVDPNGKGLARLTHTRADEASVTASPDGSRLAFARAPGAECVGCDERIALMNADGSAAVEIPFPKPADGGIGQDDHPSFSPDGSSIVFSRWNSSIGETARLYRASAAGGAPTPLGVVGAAPVWGQTRIAFISPKGIATVTPGGSGAKRVAGMALLDEGPVAWSKNGQLAVLRTAPPFAILIPSTGRRIPLPGFTEPVEHGAGLAWSPDGTKLAFVAADRDGIGDVWTVNVDGTGLTRVTRDLGAGGAVSWR